MTKGQWKTLRIGSKVWKEHNHLDFTDGGCIANTIILNGVIKRINSNFSQVLVKWDDSDFENWYGRLGIELTNQ